MSNSNAFMHIIWGFKINFVVFFRLFSDIFHWHVISTLNQHQSNERFLKSSTGRTPIIIFSHTFLTEFDVSLRREIIATPAPGNETSAIIPRQKRKTKTKTKIEKPEHFRLFDILRIIWMAILIPTTWWRNPSPRWHIINRSIASACFPSYHTGWQIKWRSTWHSRVATSSGALPEPFKFHHDDASDDVLNNQEILLL